jgi:hypothetical protein
MLITADVDQKYSQLSDDYNFAGPINSTNDTALAFSCALLDISGAIYTGAVGQIPYAIGIYYTNTLANDNGNFTYSYTTDTYFQII